MKVAFLPLRRRISALVFIGVNFYAAHMDYKCIVLAALLLLPCRGFAMDVVDATWEDVSPEIISPYSNASQHLYSFNNTIYFTHYDSGGPISSSYPYTFATLTQAGWSYLLQGSFDYSSYQVGHKPAVVYNNALYVYFGDGLYRITTNNTITFLNNCYYTQSQQYFFSYKEWLYTSCGSSQLVVTKFHHGVGDSKAVLLPTVESYLLEMSGVRFNGKYYFFGSRNQRLGAYTLKSNQSDVLDYQNVPDHEVIMPVHSFVFNQKIYLQSNKKLFISDDATHWQSIKKFQTSPTDVGLIGNYIFEYFEQGERRILYYSADAGTTWKKLRITGFKVQDHILFDSSSELIYLSALNDTGQSVVLSTKDFTNWKQIGSTHDASINDMVLTENYLYFVTEYNRIYRTLLTPSR